MLVSVSLTALALDKISSFKRHLEEQELWQILDGIELSKPLIDAIKPKEAGRATSAEYILHMLQLEGKINYTDDIIRWKRRFEEFDLDKDGFLTMEDVEAYQDGQRRQSLLDDLKRFEDTSEEAKTFDATGGPKLTKKRSILMQFTDESKDIFLETIGVKQPATYRRRSANLEEEATFNPIVRAKALRRASNITLSSQHSSRDSKSSRRHTTMHAGSRDGGRENDSGHFPKIEMVSVSHVSHRDDCDDRINRDSVQELPVSSRPFSSPPPRASDDLDFNLSSYSQTSALESLFGRISTVEENPTEVNNDSGSNSS